MAFTRTALFLKWGGDGTKYAFYVLRDSYLGGEEDKQASTARSLYDNRLLIVRASTTPRRFSGLVLGEDTATGTANDGSENISFGTIANLKAAWEATDLKAKSFEDTSYWTCEWLGGWKPNLEYDPVQKYVSVPIALEGKV